MIFPRGRIPSEEKEYLASVEVLGRAKFGSLVSADSISVETLFNKLMEPVAAVGAAEGKPSAVLTSLKQRLGKTGARLVEYAHYYWLLLAESHLTRRLFGSMLRRVEALPLPAG